MEFADLVRRRRMTRSFLDRPVEPEVLDRVLEAARRVPSAGNSQGFDFVLLEGPSETALYWDATMPAERRTSFRWQSLLGAPVIVTVWADPGRYVERYAEQDKERTGLGEGAEAWTTPYWLVDASFAAMALQYAAIDEGLGVLFFGMFDHAAAVAEALGVPADRLPVGTLALGWPDDSAEAESGSTGRSATRPRRPLDEIVHRSRW
jgi:nitroreductase